MKRGLIKGLILSLFGALAIVFLPTNILATWTTGNGNKTPVGASSNFASTVANPVAYYDSNYFPTVEGAVKSANNAGGSKTVYVIPGTNPTINKSFTINSGITLCLPYEGTTYYTTPSDSGNATLALPETTTYVKSKVQNVLATY